MGFPLPVHELSQQAFWIQRTRDVAGFTCGIDACHTMILGQKDFPIHIQKYLPSRQRDGIHSCALGRWILLSTGWSSDWRPWARLLRAEQTAPKAKVACHAPRHLLQGTKILLYLETGRHFPQTVSLLTNWVSEELKWLDQFGKTWGKILKVLKWLMILAFSKLAHFRNV